MEFEELIETLDDEINGKKGLFTKKLDMEKCGFIVNEIKNSFPQVVQESAYIIANRDKILLNADNAAKNTIKEAEERAEHIISNSELMRRAETEAKKIIDSAYGQCDKLVERTKEHLDNVFKEVEQFLTSTLNLVRKNRDELRSAMIVKK